MKWWLTIAIAATACGSEDGDSKPTTTSSGSGSAKAGSAGGFSASMSADLAKLGSGSAGSAAGSGSAAPAGSATADPKAGSATADPKAGSGSAAPAAGSGSAAVAGSADAKGSAAVAKVDAKPADAKGSAADTKAGSADAKGSAAVAKVDAKPADTKAGSADAKGSAADAKAGSATKPAVPLPPIKVSGDLAAIKLNMEPNWDRDLVEPGTISLVEKRSGKTFTFRYGYDDPRAPTDRDQYKKWLSDQRLLSVSLDRQRGAAWYLEGNDSNGAPAFRYLVNYGGKKLICGGSLYKDAESGKLGDIRDRLVIQAKQICESLSL